MTDLPQAGFQPFGVADGFIGHNGPYYWRQDSAGQTEFGFQSDARHGNPNGFLHGGSRFISTVAPGAWIGGRAAIRKVTRSFAFVDAEAFTDDKLLVTTTAIFRIFDS